MKLQKMGAVVILLISAWAAMNMQGDSASATQYTFPLFANSSKPLDTVDDGAASANTVVGRDSSGNDIAAVRTATVGLVSQGYLATSVSSVSATYGMTGNESTIEGNATSAAFTITLPVASTVTGRHYFIIKTDSSGNAVSVARSGSDTINGSTSAISLGSQWSDATLISDGTEWIKQ